MHDALVVRGVKRVGDLNLARVKRNELSIRKFLEEKGMLTVPADIRHYTLKPLPDYLVALSDFAETDDFTGPLRLNEDAVRWISPPSPELGYFWLATAKDPRPEIVHEGVPGHYFQPVFILEASRSCSPALPRLWSKRIDLSQRFLSK